MTRRKPILGGRSYLRIGTVDTGKIVIMLDLAITATEAPEDGSARTQSKTFRDVAGTYAKWTATAQQQASVAPVE